MNYQREVKYHIFISYSSRDEYFAIRLEKDLVDNGYIVFRDKNRLRHGENFRQQLMQAILDSFGLIVIWSEASTISDYVPNEVSMAKKHGKAIFPIKIDDCIPFGYDDDHSFILKNEGYDRILSKLLYLIPKTTVSSAHQYSEGFFYNTKLFLKWIIIKLFKWVSIFLVLLLTIKCAVTGKEVFKNFPSPPAPIETSNSSVSFWKTLLPQQQECYETTRPQLSKKLDLSTEAWKENISFYCKERTFNPTKHKILKSEDKFNLDKLVIGEEFSAIGHISIAGERFYVTDSTFKRTNEPRLIYIPRD